jgi:hypothetical protein
MFPTTPLTRSENIMLKDYLEKLPFAKMQNLRNSLFELEECVNSIAAAMEDAEESETDTNRFWRLGKVLESAYIELDDFLP